MTDLLLADFQRYVADVQASNGYLGWARDNHGGRGYSVDNPKPGSELARWVPFRDQILRGTRPTPPALVTPFGKSLVDAGVEYLDATAPTPPPPTPTWDKLYTGGDFDSFARSLGDDKVGALGPGVLGTLTYALALDNSQKPSQRVKLTSADPTRPGKIGGRVDIRTGVNGWTFDNLYLDEATAYGTTGASHVIAAPTHFVRCDGTNHNTKIFMVFNPGSGGTTIAQTRVHHCGHIFASEADARAAGATAVYPLVDGSGWVGNHDQGLYLEGEGEGITITDSIIEYCADRGLQFRGTQGSLARNVLVQHCGEGVIFGDMVSTGNRVEKSILRNNRALGRCLVEETGSDVSGNVVDDNYIYNDDGRPTIDVYGGVTVTNPHTGTPAAGYGPLLPVGPTG